MLAHLLPLLQPRAGEAIYVEPFGGSGVVLLNKDRHPAECYNDRDGELVNLYRVLRDPDAVVHLWWELVNTPVSREEFRDALTRRRIETVKTPIERAAAFVVSCRQRFGGGQPGDTSDSDRNWGTSREISRGMNGMVSRWLGALDQLPAVHRRVATVVVDQQDGVRCIEQWDEVSTLFYVDPPYVDKEHFYEGAFGVEDHRRLGAALNVAKGRVVLSYYPCDLVNELYPKERWQRRAIDVLATACGHPRKGPGQQMKRDPEKLKRTELILTNFDPETRKRIGG